MKNQWGGHSAITRSKLLTILERAAGGCEDFSVPERVLYAACEFWSAVNARALKAFLGANAVQQLRDFAAVFGAIGAIEVVREVDEALEALDMAGTNSQCAECIQRLQEQLRQSTDPLKLNDLVARFAQRVH